LKIGNLIQMVFNEKFFKTYASKILFCSFRDVEQNAENKIQNGNHMTENNHLKKFTFFSGDD
jgi:hypothetical protein